MNRPTPDPSQEGSRHSSAFCSIPLLGGVRGWVHGPNACENANGAFHDCVAASRSRSFSTL